jgi:hypothetical protein
VHHDPRAAPPRRAQRRAYSSQAPYPPTAPGIRPRYSGLIFRRNPKDTEEPKRIVGVDHRLFDRAIAQAVEWEGTLASIRDLSRPLGVLVVRDAVTGRGGLLRQSVVGVTRDETGNLALLRDEKVLEIFNRRRPGGLESDGPPDERVCERRGGLVGRGEAARDHDPGLSALAIREAVSQRFGTVLAERALTHCRAERRGPLFTRAPAKRNPATPVASRSDGPLRGTLLPVADRTRLTVIGR